MSESTTFVFENDRAYALVNSQVVASADSVEELEKLAEDIGHDDYIEDADPASPVGDSLSATHVETPNGLQGQILGRVKDIWGETVTVRFANGTIKEIPVSQDLTFTAEKSDDDKESPIERFKKKLEKGNDDLDERKEELEDVKKSARQTIASGVSYSDQEELHNIVVAADYELGDVSDALAHRQAEDAQAFDPLAPFDTHVVEQESMGHGGSDWLDSTVSDMITEAEETDYAKLLNEGPETLAAGVDDSVIADGGAVREIASSFIRTRTATAEPELRERYETAFLSRVEQCRRTELASRKTAVRKQAKTEKEEFDSVSDDALFM